MRSHVNSKVEESSASLHVHSPFFPEDLRESDLTKCKIKVQNSEYETSVFRLSPLGVEIIKSKSLGALKVGESVDLELQIDKQKSQHKGVVVAYEYERNGRNLVGIRLVCNEITEVVGTDRRKEERFFTAPGFQPTASAANPLKYNDILLFRVKEISSTGLFLVTSLRNKSLLKDLELELLLCLPVFGNITVQAKIENLRIIREEGKEYLGIGLSLLGPSEEFKRIAGSYLLQFSDTATPMSLKTSGFPVKDFGKTIDFRYVKTEEDYHQVLALRKLAYAAEGKVDADAPVESLATPQDAKARIIMGYFKGQLVSSAAVIFHDDSSMTEHEEFADCGSLMPQKNQMVEINRVCTHPHFRRSDLFLQMYRFLLVLIVQSRRRYVLICATKELSLVYQKLGFDLTGIRYSHAKLNHQEHAVLKCDIYKKVSGHGVDPITWNFVLDSILPTILKHATDKGIPLDMSRITLYSLFKPLVPLFVRVRKFRQKSTKNKSEPKKSLATDVAA